LHTSVDVTVHKPDNLSNIIFDPVTSNPSNSFAPARCDAFAIRSSRMIRLTAQHAASPSFSFDTPANAAKPSCEAKAKQ
jgi:hypothetical protein